MPIELQHRHCQGKPSHIEEQQADPRRSQRHHHGLRQALPATQLLGVAGARVVPAQQHEGHACQAQGGLAQRKQTNNAHEY